MKKIAALACVVALFGMSAPINGAYADPPWEKGSKGHGGGKEHKSRKHDRDGDRTVIIVDRDRGYIRDYIGRDYKDHCPPGLAKKHNGCMPPGHARRYVVGQPLMVVYEEVPYDLMVRLEPVPVGYRYVRVDRDVLLISEASKKVIDAVTLLSAVGN